MVLLSAMQTLTSFFPADAVRAILDTVSFPSGVGTFQVGLPKFSLFAFSSRAFCSASSARAVATMDGLGAVYTFRPTFRLLWGEVF